MSRGIELNAPQAGRPTTTVPAAAHVLGIDVRTVRARITRGELAGGAVEVRRRQRWFVYSDALMGQMNDHRADVAARHTVKKAASLLLQAYAELQAGLNRDSDGLDYFGRARAELTAHEEAMTRSFQHLQAALALIGDEQSGAISTEGPG